LLIIFWLWFIGGYKTGINGGGAEMTHFFALLDGEISKVIGIMP
jgi:hypothetical protein